MCARPAHAGGSIAAVLLLVCLVPLISTAGGSDPIADSAPGTWSSPTADRNPDTLWIFDADFEDFGGCNAGTEDLGDPGDELTGWFTFDFSEHPPLEPQWHVDTFRAFQDGQPPDRSFWCGRRDTCWPMAGYGDRWCQLLWRDVDLTSFSADSLELSFRQRVGLESGYDYGYVELAVADGTPPDTFETVHCISNIPFGSTPGAPINWDHWDPELSHPVIDIGSWAGHQVRIRWRLESDASYSSERWSHCNTHAAFTDGGWYIDEVEVRSAGQLVFTADFEDSLNPDNAGWVASDGGSEQVGVTWRRVPSDSLAAPPPGGTVGDWVIAAVDAETGLTADGQWASIVTPPFGVSGITDYDAMVLELTGYFDLPSDAPAYVTMRVSVDETVECLGSRSSFCEALSLPMFDEGWHTVAFPLDPQYVGAVLSGSHMSLCIEQARGVTRGAPARGILLDRLRVGTTEEIGTSVPNESPTSPARLSLAVVSPFASGSLLCRVRGAHGPTIVDIFDPAGRFVRHLSEVHFDGDGALEVCWDGLTDEGRSVTRGVYLVRVKCGSTVAAGKTVVLE